MKNDGFITKIIIVMVTAFIISCENNKIYRPDISVELELPEDNAVFEEPDSIVFVWHVENGEADKFEIEISASPDTTDGGDFRDPIHRKTVSGTRYVWGNIQGVSEVYHWHVKISDPIHGWSKIRSFRVEFPLQLPPPEPISPSNSHTIVDSDTVRFVWHSIQEATEYEIQISRNQTFSQLVASETLSDTEFSWSVVDTGWFWWRVRAMTGSLSSDWSNTYSFRVEFTEFIAMPPRLIFPIDTALFFQTNIGFVWGSVQGASQYRLQVSTDSCFSELVHDTVIAHDTMSIWTPPHNETFWWRVKSMKNRFESRWSEPVKFSMTPYILSSIPIRANFSLTDGNILFVLDDDGWFRVYDISNPNEPSELSGLAWGSSCQLRSMAKLQNFIFVPAGICGFRVVDVSNPSSPTVSTINIDHTRYIAIESDYGCVLTTHSKLQVVDLSEPSNPTFCGEVSIPQRGNQLVVKNNTAYIADMDAGVVLLDVSNRANPDIISTVELSSSALSVAIKNSLLLVGTENGTLYIVDVSSPQNPNVINSVSVSNSPITSIAFFGNYLLLSTSEGIAALDFTVSTSPTLIGVFPDVRSPSHIEVTDSIATMSSVEGLWLVKLK